MPRRAAEGRALHGRQLRSRTRRATRARRHRRCLQSGRLPRAARHGQRRAGAGMSTGPQSLASVQRWMHEALVFPRRVAHEAIDGQLASFPGLSGAAGLAIYQRGYFLRIASCMREQFPALCHALGEPLFNDFVVEYIRERPPESHTLYDLGRRLPAFLDESRPDRDQPPEEREVWIDFMVDLARFERQMFVMFDAPGHEGKPFAESATP